MSEDALIRLANLKALGLAPGDLVAKVGNSYPYWRDLLAGNKSFGEKAARNIEAKLKLARGSLDVPGSTVHHLAKLPEAGITVPLLDIVASMGYGSETRSEDAVTGALTLSPSWVHDRVRPSQASALRFIHSYGDSMSPTFNSGDVLLVDTGVRDAKIDGVYVLKAHERLFVKRVRQRMDGVFEVSSDNPAHKTADTLNGDSQVEVLGRVLWAWNGRTI